uniref:Uncharacterized protein n=1 Tax=Arundo donax TaxID=35708 RepID=A0A0A9BHQ9_ARUDO
MRNAKGRYYARHTRGKKTQEAFISAKNCLLKRCTALCLLQFKPIGSDSPPPYFIRWLINTCSIIQIFNHSCITNYICLEDLLTKYGMIEL